MKNLLRIWLLKLLLLLLLLQIYIKKQQQIYIKTIVTKISAFFLIVQVETFSWNICATAMQNKFEQALYRDIKGRNLYGNVEAGLEIWCSGFWLEIKKSVTKPTMLHGATPAETVLKNSWDSLGAGENGTLRKLQVVAEVGHFSSPFQLDI